MPFWLYYFNVGDIDATAQRVKAGGGQILEGPLEAWDGSWIIRCKDPQGAVFALEGPRDPKPVGYFERGTRDEPGHHEPEMVLVRISLGSLRLQAAAKRELPDRAFDMEFNPGHFREQVDIGAPDRASAQSHVGRHQVERLNQHADILQDQRIGERAVFP